MKLYFIQEVLNESEPTSCVGELQVFASEAERDEIYIDLQSKYCDSEYHYFYKFERELFNLVNIQTTT